MKNPEKAKVLKHQVMQIKMLAINQEEIKSLEILSKEKLVEFSKI